jgi:hypothetical protein
VTKVTPRLLFSLNTGLACQAERFS